MCGQASAEADASREAGEERGGEDGGLEGWREADPAEEVSRPRNPDLLEGVREALRDYGRVLGPLVTARDIALIREAAELLKNWPVKTEPMEARWEPLIPLANRLAALVNPEEKAIPQ